MISKLWVLLLAAMALTGALADSATAAVWKDKGVNVTTPFSLTLVGAEAVDLDKSGQGAVECEVHATLTSSGGSTGKITTWDQEDCFGAGDLGGCLVTLAEAKSLPWTITVNAKSLSISSGSVKFHFSSIKGGSCPFADGAASVASLELVPNSTTSIAEFEIPSPFFYGSLVVQAPNSGTYGIG
jgi:hypothetical protein